MLVLVFFDEQRKNFQLIAFRRADFSPPQLLNASKCSGEVFLAPNRINAHFTVSALI
ncbi:hypothetical protein D3C79_1023860 [compost metagenome]